MYKTPDGVRILRDGEARLFESAAAMMVDVLADADTCFGMQPLHGLAYIQKLKLFEQLLEALFREDVAAPEVSPALDAMALAVYVWIERMVTAELRHDGQFPCDRSLATWRELLLATAEEMQPNSTRPNAENRVELAWQELVWTLAPKVVWDFSHRSSSEEACDRFASWDNATTTWDETVPTAAWRATIERLKQLTAIDR